MDTRNTQLINPFIASFANDIVDVLDVPYGKFLDNLVKLNFNDTEVQNAFLIIFDSNKLSCLQDLYNYHLQKQSKKG